MVAMRAQYVRKVIDMLPYDVPIDSSHQSFSVLLYLFRMRDKNGEKSRGRKIKAFVKRRDGKGYMLYAVFEDGSEVDWSWQKALGIRDKYRNVLNAFRYEVMYSVLSKRDSHTFGDFIITDDGKVTHRDDVHIHHEEEFSKILNDFLREKGLKMKDIELEDIGKGYRLKDRELAREWIQYHNEKAKLRIITKQDHIKLHQRVQ